MDHHQQITEPSQIVIDGALLLKEKSRILDLACGGGRNGRHLVSMGHDVLFLDRDVSGVADIENNAGVEICEANLEDGSNWPPADRKFDMVIVVNYLWRPIILDILGCVNIGGYLVYETFATGNEAYGKPSNPDFLLAEGELEKITKGSFEILRYRHGFVEYPKPAIKQNLIALKKS